MLQIQPKQLGNAVLLHGNAIQNIGSLHGAAAVCDHNKLRFIANAAQILCIANNIYIVKRGFDLVQNAERRRVYGQNGKIDADGHQCLLAARKR